MDDIKVKFDNLIAAIEYLQANSNAEYVTISSLGHGTGITISFVDKSSKACKLTVYTDAITPEVTTTAKIYRRK